MKSARSTAVLLFFACLTVLQSGAVPARAATRPLRLLLITPTEGRKVDGQAVLFSWKAEETDSTFKPRFYEVQIWDRAKNFRRTVRVQAEDSTGYGQAWIQNPRQVFRKHGTYLWRVAALDGNGRQRISGTRRFVMPPPRIKPLMAGPGKGYSLRLEYNYWSDFDSYRRFTDPLYPKTHLKSYADIGIGFRQSWETAVPFTVQERLLLLSQVGMGAELTPRVRILQNTFLAVDPWVRGRQCWYSTSLKYYSGTISEIAAGADFVVMPGGHLVLSGAWLPVNRIRYGLRGGGLRTLQGAGWEAGVTVTLPRSLLSVVRVAGVNVDFQRMPLGFVFGRVEDGLTDIRLDYRRFSIEYLF